MGLGSKYIIVDNSFALLLDTQCNHCDVVNPSKVTGAGFCKFQIGIDSSSKKRKCDVTVFGRSSTLNIDSKESDIFFIKTLLVQGDNS